MLPNPCTKPGSKIARRITNPKDRAPFSQKSLVVPLQFTTVVCVPHVIKKFFMAVRLLRNLWILSMLTSEDKLVWRILFKSLSWTDSEIWFSPFHLYWFSVLDPSITPSYQEFSWSIQVSGQKLVNIFLTSAIMSFMISEICLWKMFSWWKIFIWKPEVSPKP